MRPAYGFALQAIGRGSATASELGRLLGVSEQAAGKTVDRLVALGYAERADDPGDARRKVIRLTPHGSTPWPARRPLFEELRAQWAAALGPDRLRALEADLRAVTPLSGIRLDAPGWSGG